MTHSLSNTSHSKRKNRVQASNYTMLKTTSNKNMREKKAFTTNTRSDSRKSPQPLDHTEVLGVHTVSEDAASEVEAVFVAEEHP